MRNVRRKEHEEVLQFGLVLGILLGVIGMGVLGALIGWPI